MKSVQAYETTVADDERTKIARFVVFPQRAFLNNQVPTAETELREFFSLSEFRKLENASELPRALAALLAADDLRDLPTPQTESQPIPSLSSPAVIKPDLFAFAEELSFAQVVPFESSLLSLQAMATIFLKAAKGGAVPLGAVAALVAVGTTPALLVAVPAGIVLCGGAIAFGKWVDENRDEVFSKVFGLKPKHRPGRGAKGDAKSGGQKSA